jgi:spore coat protein U-like protein
MSLRRTIRRIRLPAAVVVAAFMLPGLGHAAPCSGSLKITATAVAFGNYNAAASPTTANGTVTVSCPGAAGTLPAYTVSLSTGGAGSYTPRAMTSGVPQLQYNLYTTAGYATVWGDGTGATAIVAGGNAGNNSETLTVYGRIPSAQYVTPGAYTDTITATVTF